MGQNGPLLHYLFNTIVFIKTCLAYGLCFKGGDELCFGKTLFFTSENGELTIIWSESGEKGPTRSQRKSKKPPERGVKNLKTGDFFMLS